MNVSERAFERPSVSVGQGALAAILPASAALHLAVTGERFVEFNDASVPLAVE